MKTYFRSAASVLMIMVGSAAVVGAAKNSPDFVRITPAEIHWQDVPGGHGAQQAVLLGDGTSPVSTWFAPSFRRTSWIIRIGIPMLAT